MPSSNTYKENQITLTNGRNGGDNFAQLELIQDGGFTGGVETNHQNAHFLLAKELREKSGEAQTHGEWLDAFGVKE